MCWDGSRTKLVAQGRYHSVFMNTINKLRNNLRQLIKIRHISSGCFCFCCVSALVCRGPSGSRFWSWTCLTGRTWSRGLRHRARRCTGRDSREAWDRMHTRNKRKFCRNQREIQIHCTIQIVTHTMGVKKKLIAERNYLRLHSMSEKKTDALDKRMTGARKRQKVRRSCTNLQPPESIYRRAYTQMINQKVNGSRNTITHTSREKKQILHVGLLG